MNVCGIGGALYMQSMLQNDINFKAFTSQHLNTASHAATKYDMNDLGLLVGRRRLHDMI